MNPDIPTFVEDSTMQGKLVQLLSRIPDFQDPPKEVGALAQESSVDGETAAIVIEVMRLFSAVNVENSDRGSENVLVRASSEGAGFLIKSLAWYVDNREPIVTDWTRLGVESDGDSVNKIPIFGATFLKLLDIGRKNLTPYRRMRIAKAIIVARTRKKGENRYLVKYETAISQYQLVGGRYRDADGDTTNTVEREFREEAALASQTDVIVKTNLLASGVAFTMIAPTIGALTEYIIDYYHIGLSELPATNDPGLEWVTEQELRNGETRSGVKINEPAFGEFLQKLRAPLSDVPPSQSTFLRRYHGRRPFHEMMRVALEDRPLAVTGILLTIIGIVITLIFSL